MILCGLCLHNPIPRVLVSHVVFARIYSCNGSLALLLSLNRMANVNILRMRRPERLGEHNYVYVLHMHTYATAPHHAFAILVERPKFNKISIVIETINGCFKHTLHWRCFAYTICLRLNYFWIAKKWESRNTSSMLFEIQACKHRLIHWIWSSRTRNRKWTYLFALLKDETINTKHTFTKYSNANQNRI